MVLVPGWRLNQTVTVNAVGMNAYGDRLQSSTVPATDTWTFCAWIKLADTAGSRPFSIEDGTGVYHSISIVGASGTDLFIDTNLGTSTVLRTLSVGTWYFVALSATHTASFPTMNLYVRAQGEGSLTNTFTDGVAALTPSFAAIGGGPSFNSTPNGSICQYRLWDRVLNSTELLAESRSATVVSSTNLLSFYKLESAATVLTATNGATLTNPGGAGTWTTDTSGPTLT